MRTVSLVENNLHGWAGHAGLYHVDPPIADSQGVSRSHVIISATHIPTLGRSETMVFPALSTGVVVEMREICGVHAWSHPMAIEVLKHLDLPQPE